VMRYLPIVEGATGGQGWARHLVLGFGSISILVAAAFILVQRDLKRLLAYHSVEHLGIIALGLGLGGLGTFAGLFHTLNHSLCKALSFFAAGRLGQVFGSHDMHKMSGGMAVAPLWGAAIFMSILALVGTAPFALFVSEIQIMKAAIEGREFLALAVFLLGTLSVFVGALGHALPLTWGEPAAGLTRLRSSNLERALVIVPLALLVCLGLWMPDFIRTAPTGAAEVIENSAALKAAALPLAGGSL